MEKQDKEHLYRYFPDLSETQWGQLELLPSLYQEWNAKINVISRKDIDNIVINHILHSMSIGKYITFAPNTKVFDIGTGGGFPGIPLSILYPKASFTLIDSVGKKIKVVKEIINAVGLKNATAIQVRAEELKGERCHFVVSRAAMSLERLVGISQSLVDVRNEFNPIKNGIIALKGGDLTEELAQVKRPIELSGVATYFQEIPFYEEKKIVYVPL